LRLIPIVAGGVAANGEALYVTPDDHTFDAASGGGAWSLALVPASRPYAAVFAPRLRRLAVDRHAHVMA
jgi:hypothetical protein